MRADGVFYGELVSSAVRDNGDVTRQSVPTAVDRTVHPGAYKTGHELENVVAGNSSGFAKTPIGGPDSFSWDSDEHDEVSLFM
jgi:hypothetical protein